MVPTFQCSPKYRRRISACCSGVIMAGLRGHATDSPGRWKEPRAFGAADHTAQRARQGRSRRSIRRRVREQCDRRCRGAGSLIPHAGAIRALVITMIEAAFRAAPMPAARGADRVVTGGHPTRRRAIRVAPITRRADREEAVAAPADFLAKRRVHVGAAAHSNWTRSEIVTQETATGLGPSEHRGGHRGSGGAKLQALTSPWRQLTRLAPFATIRTE